MFAKNDIIFINFQGLFFFLVVKGKKTGGCVLIWCPSS